MARPIRGARGGAGAKTTTKHRPDADLTLEAALAAEALGAGRDEVVIGGFDEVGRGAIAGPVVVGACAVAFRVTGTEATAAPAPEGITDSKLLSPARREALAPRIARWALASATGWAGAAEIDRIGISAALGIAARRALAGLGTRLDAAVVDGPFDWLSPRDDALAAAPSSSLCPVTTRIKADVTCASVAGASILAKVARDREMVRRAVLAPGYEWEANKGYGTAAHRAAFAQLGPSAEHRRSWNLGQVH